MGFPRSMGVLFLCWLFGFFCLKPVLSDLPFCESDLEPWNCGSFKPSIISTWKFSYDYWLSIKLNCSLLWGRKTRQCQLRHMKGQWDIWTYIDKEGMGWAPERSCRKVLPGLLSEGKVFPVYPSGIHSHADISLYVGYFLTLIASQRANDTRN